MLSKARTAICATFLTGLALVAQTTSAEALQTDIGSGTGNCPSGQMCLWADYDFHQGQGVSKLGSLATSTAISDLGKIYKDGAVDWGMQDVASSAYNNSGSRWCLYVDNGYSGTYLWVDPGWQGQLYSPFQDSISSLKPCSG
ncbi:hypothetical protein GCM10010129_68810 [Streptomyces fumigatiscleroticus]|nr:hypothetical protein GCM10010129_68810 [Streptomyces fumigatiscleroticus]